MKEFSIEQKSKAYDEALEKARIWKDKSGMPKDRQGILDDIFPELAEGEDERIRKELVSFLKETIEYGGISPDIWTMDNANKWLAWLEKQGEQKPIDKIQLGKKYKCIASPRYSTFMIGEIYKPEDEFLCSFMNFCSDCFEPIEDGEQKPADKVEPKFHEGDWIISDTVDKDYHICKITGIKDGNYTIESTCGYKGYNQFDVFDTAYKLWTIQDAKDGDVLTCYSDIKGQPIEQTGIIKQYVGRHGGCSNSFKAHFGVDWDNNVVIEGYMGSSNIYPSTKEQRDTLMKAMADAGYTFDFEKKELKKVGCEADCTTTKEWSEEDECCINQLIIFCENCMVQDSNAKKCANWLKSLKERYTWKPSDEQMNALSKAIAFVFDSNSDVKHSLKSLYNELKKL